MNQLDMKTTRLFIAASIITLASASCSDDAPEPLLWECWDYDRDRISVEFTPNHYVQGQIIADDDYAGEINVTCTNYPEIGQEANSMLGYVSDEVGFTLVKTGSNTFKITFDPIEVDESEPPSIRVELFGLDGKEHNTSYLDIGRRKSDRLRLVK